MSESDLGRRGNTCFSGNTILSLFQKLPDGKGNNFSSWRKKFLKFNTGEASPLQEITNGKETLFKKEISMLEIMENAHCKWYNCTTERCILFYIKAFSQYKLRDGVFSSKSRAEGANLVCIKLSPRKIAMVCSKAMVLCAFDSNGTYVWNRRKGDFCRWQF